MTQERKLEWLALDTLVGAEKNPKRHAAEDITKSITRFGYVEPVVLDSRTQRLVAGHGRVEALKSAKAAGIPPPDGVQLSPKGDWLLPVLTGWASKDDKEAESYLLASNQITAKGGWDNIDLADMLKGLDATLSLEGTGFAAKDIEFLLTSPRIEVGETLAAEEWVGMPDFHNTDGRLRRIVVHFDTQADVDSFAKLLGQEVTEKTRHLWHPYKENRVLKDLCYADESSVSPDTAPEVVVP